MKRFLKRKLLGVPVGVLLVLIVVSAVAATGLLLWSGSVNLVVGEPFTAWCRVDSGSWVVVTDSFSLNIVGAYPGKCYDIGVHIKNASSADLLARVVAVVPTGIGLNYTSSLFGAGYNVPGGGHLERSFTLCVAGNTTAGNYTVPLALFRG